MSIEQAYKETLDEIEKCLKGIHYPLCDMEKYVFDYETDELNNEVQNIHRGYMQIQMAINNIRKLRVENITNERRRKATSERNFGMSYIVKNCPATGAGCCGDTCPEITDCPLKQIVEKCKLFQNNYLVNDGVQLLTTNILNSLDIQEVE